MYKSLLLPKVYTETAVIEHFDFIKISWNE